MGVVWSLLEWSQDFLTLLPALGWKRHGAEGGQILVSSCLQNPFMIWRLAVASMWFRETPCQRPSPCLGVLVICS